MDLDRMITAQFLKPAEIAAEEFPIQYLGVILDKFRLGIALIDTRFRFVSANRTLSIMDGFSEAEHIGNPIEDVAGCFIEEIRSAVEYVFLTGKAVSNFSASRELFGQFAIFRGTASYFPLKNKYGRIVQVGLIVMDAACDYPWANDAGPGIFPTHQETEHDFQDNNTRSLKRNGADNGAGELQHGTDDKKAGAHKIAEGPDKPEPSANGSGEDVNKFALARDEAENGEIDLSPRERDVLRLLALGKSNKEIAAFLAISSKTVETYRSRLMRKVQAPTLVHLVHYAIKHRIVDLQA